MKLYLLFFLLILMSLSVEEHTCCIYKGNTTCTRCIGALMCEQYVFCPEGSINATRHTLIDMFIVPYCCMCRSES